MPKSHERNRTPRQRRRYRARGQVWLDRNSNTPSLGKDDPFDGGYCCHYCKRYYRKKHITKDHIVPKALWSEAVHRDQKLNIVQACLACNREKADKMPTCVCKKCRVAVETYQAWAQFRLGVDFTDAA